MLSRTLFILLFFGITATHAEITSPRQMIMGYVSIWGLQDHNVISKIDPNTITHLAYSFLDINKNGKCELLGAEDESKNQSIEILNEFKELKIRTPQIKTILSIGGYGNSKYFSDVAKTEESRKIFAESCIQYLKQYSFDGIDIDWEFPVTGGLKTNHVNRNDSANQVLLMQEFRTQLDQLQKIEKINQHYSLSVAVSGEKHQLRTFDIKNLAPLVDWFGLMAYDMCHDRPCNHSSLYAYDSDHSYAEETIHSMLQQGAQSKQIVLGVPFYGYSWTNKNGTPKRTFTDYSTILKKSQNYTKYIDPKSGQPWLISPDHKVKINYDDEASLHNKALYAEKHHFAGTLIWELSDDDDQFTLLKALNLQ